MRMNMAWVPTIVDSDEIEVVRKYAEKYSVPDLMADIFPLDAKPWYT